MFAESHFSLSYCVSDWSILTYLLMFLIGRSLFLIVDHLVDSHLSIMFLLILVCSLCFLMVTFYHMFIMFFYVCFYISGVHFTV